MRIHFNKDGQIIHCQKPYWMLKQQRMWIRARVSVWIRSVECWELYRFADAWFEGEVERGEPYAYDFWEDWEFEHCEWEEKDYLPALKGLLRWAGAKHWRLRR